jgi:hypothetical protein
MGLFDFLRRLTLPKNAPRCYLCKEGIPPRDLERGKALILGRQPYCRGCVRVFTNKSPSSQSHKALPADSSSHAAPA